MNVRDMLNPGHPQSLTAQASDESITAQRLRTISRGGGLSQPRTCRRSLRSYSARTASDHGLSNPKTHTPPTTSALPPAPLYKGTSRACTASRSRKPGSVISSSSSVRTTISESTSQICTQPLRRKHIRRGLSDRRDASLSAHYRATLLLWHARQYIDEAAGLPGRRPCIMDVILDLKLEYNEDTLIEILQRRREKMPLCHRQYVSAVTDEQSLHMYWTEQAAVWRGVWPIDEGPSTSTRFPDSDERSTVAWMAASNGGLCDL